MLTSSCHSLLPLPLSCPYIPSSSISSFLCYFPHLSSSLPHPQASSAPVISPLRGTMAFWTRFRPCVGSMRTLATSAETRRGSLFSALELERHVSTSSSSLTIQRVIVLLLVCFLGETSIFLYLSPHIHLLSSLCVSSQ